VRSNAVVRAARARSRRRGVPRSQRNVFSSPSPRRRLAARHAARPRERT